MFLFSLTTLNLLSSHCHFYWQIMWWMKSYKMICPFIHFLIWTHYNRLRFNFFIWLFLGFSMGEQVWSVYLCWPRQLTEDQSSRFPRQPTALHPGEWLQHGVVNSYFCPEANTVRENHCSQGGRCSRQCWVWVSHWLGLGRFPGFLRPRPWGPFSRQMLPVVCLWCHS